MPGDDPLNVHTSVWSFWCIYYGVVFLLGAGLCMYVYICTRTSWLAEVLPSFTYLLT